MIEGNSLQSNLHNNYNVVCSGPTGTEFKKQTVKYTAQRLHEKGVVLEIDGLPKHQ